MGHQFTATITDNETDIERSYLVDYDKIDGHRGFFGYDGGEPPEPDYIEINWIKDLLSKKYVGLAIEEENEILEQAELDYKIKVDTND
jgi:hypothetical protein